MNYDQRQRRIWRHNGFSGHVAMMRQQLRGIIDADSTTIEAKAIATTMFNCTEALAKAIKTRVDP